MPVDVHLDVEVSIFQPSLPCASSRSCSSHRAQTVTSIVLVYCLSWSNSILGLTSSAGSGRTCGNALTSLRRSHPVPRYLLYGSVSCSRPHPHRCILPVASRNDNALPRARSMKLFARWSRAVGQKTPSWEVFRSTHHKPREKAELHALYITPLLLVACAILLDWTATTREAAGVLQHWILNSLTPRCSRCTFKTDEQDRDYNTMRAKIQWQWTNGNMRRWWTQRRNIISKPEKPGSSSLAACRL